MELTLHGDRTVKAVAKELELPPWQLYGWRKFYAPRPGAAGPAPQTLEGAVQESARFPHLSRLMRGILLKGNSLAEITPELWPPLAFLVVVMAVGAQRYRQTLD